MFRDILIFIGGYIAILLLAAYLTGCSTVVSSSTCGWADSEIELEFAVAREMVRRELGADPGPVVGARVRCKNLGPLSGRQLGHTLEVEYHECINKSALMHEAIHLLLEEATGNADPQHERYLWQFEQFERRCGRVPGMTYE